MGQDEDLWPRPQRLSEQYGDDRMKTQQAMMDLYKREKVNPLGGCLPILIQIPVHRPYCAAGCGGDGVARPGWAGSRIWSVKDPFYIPPPISGCHQLHPDPPEPGPPDPGSRPR